MQRTMLGGKIHRATVTEADLEYEGSITIDRELLDAAGILPGEAVHIWDVTNGARLTTYALSGEPGSGEICVNGGAAHHVRPGDRIVIATLVQLEDAEARQWQPKAVFVDAHNRISRIGAEHPHMRAVV